MKWFRKTAMSLVILTMVFALGITAGIINRCTNSSHTKSIESDPFYNGNLGLYLLNIVIQLTILGLGVWCCILAYNIWRNNNQMDHKLRHQLISWLSTWCILCLVELAFAIYLIVKDKEPQGELAYLYQIFTKYNQDTRLVAHFERYQRENSCCGIYGPDDWMMVTLRAGMGGAGGAPGASSFQSMDYGFRQNPSTGQCHLTPPTIPMGCGLKMMEEIHYLLYVVAAMMILKTLVGITAATFVGYCFYYWLDKEVIVIPEDEVSNLIIMEADSSSTDTSAASVQGGPGFFPGPGAYLGGGGYLVAGSEAPYLGPPASQYPQLSGFIPGSNFQGSFGGSAGFPPNGSHPFGSYPFPPAVLSADPTYGTGVAPAPTDPTGNPAASPGMVNPPAPPPMPGLPEPPPDGLQSKAGLYDANSMYYGSTRSSVPNASQYRESFTYRAPRNVYLATDIPQMVQHILSNPANPREQAHVGYSMGYGGYPHPMMGQQLPMIGHPQSIMGHQQQMIGYPHGQGPAYSSPVSQKQSRQSKRQGEVTQSSQEPQRQGIRYRQQPNYRRSNGFQDESPHKNGRSSNPRSDKGRPQPQQEFIRADPSPSKKSKQVNDRRAETQDLPQGQQKNRSPSSRQQGPSSRQGDDSNSNNRGKSRNKNPDSEPNRTNHTHRHSHPRSQSQKQPYQDTLNKLRDQERAFALHDAFGNLGYAGNNLTGTMTRNNRERRPGDEEVQRREQSSHNSQSSAYSNRSRGTRYDPENTEVIFKNPQARE